MSAQIANVSLWGGNTVDIVVMVAFLNSWMHAWKKTEIGLYSPAADFKKSSMAFFLFSYLSGVFLR